MEVRTFGMEGAVLVVGFACAGAGVCSWAAGTSFFFVFLGKAVVSG